MPSLKVHGCPGSGKTERLLRLIEKHDTAYTAYFITFSRNQAAEARDRGNLDPSHCGTFHSVLSRIMELHPEDFLRFKASEKTTDLLSDQKNINEWAERLGIQRDLAKLPNDCFEDPCFLTEGMTRGEILMSEFSAAREGLRPIYDGLLPGFGRSPKEIYLEYCEAKGTLLDYTDILEKAVRENPWPPTSLLIVDEAHDLSPVMWVIVRAWSHHAEEVVIAGDPFQAIYGFRGAVPEQFTAWPGKEEYLSDSYRCSDFVAETANRVGANFRTMRYQPFHGRRWLGKVIRTDRFDQTFSILQEWGITLILARTHRLITKAAEQLIDAGIPFRDLGNGVRRSPWTNALLECANGLACIADGQEPTFEQREGIIKFLPPTLVNELGSRPILPFLRSRIGLMDIESVAHCLHLSPRAGRALWNHGIGRPVPCTDPKKITISLGTIHASKGLGAQTVILITDLSGKAAEAYYGLETSDLGLGCSRSPEQRRDEEMRLLFVGVTRASERLVITRIGKGATYEL